jgi:hypothetical protein
MADWMDTQGLVKKPVKDYWVEKTPHPHEHAHSLYVKQWLVE